MGYMDDMPFWSPHTDARLFKRYTFEKDIQVDDNVQLAVELDNYKNYESFKWVYQTSTQTQTGQVHTNYLADTNFFTIRTNSQEDFRQGDIIWLQSADFPEGAYFIITDPVNNGYLYSGKQVPTFQDISLRSLLHEV